MTVAPGALRTRVLAFRRPATTTPVVQGMTAMIHRLLAAYAVVGLLPGVPMLLDQAPTLPPAWLLALGVVQTVVVVGMLVLAVQGRALGHWLLAFAVLTLAAVLSLALVASSGEFPFVWFHVGLAVVCAAVWGGVRVGAGYAAVLTAAWTLLRLLPGGGGVGLTEAVGGALYGTTAGLAVGVIARGMLAAGQAADGLAAELRHEGVRRVVGRALADERARLDQLIHDDVMTTLSAAAQSTGAGTGRATAGLARDTLVTIDGLRDSPTEGGTLSASVVADLVDQTARRVSPEVVVVARLPAGSAALRVPDDVAQVLLSAVREAVRNAVRHSGATTVEVQVDAVPRGDEISLQVEVRDDGRSFDLAAVPADRLGVRVSMLEATRQRGLQVGIVSAPGAGTTFSLRWAGSSTAGRSSLAREPRSDPGLPADFPAAQFSAVTWLALAVGLGVGLATVGTYRALPPLLVGMVLAVVATALVLRPGRGLRLATGPAVGTVVAVAGVCAAMDLAMPPSALGLLVWHFFSVQLVLVALVVRGRPGLGLLGLVVVEASVLVRCLTGPDGWSGVLAWGWGPVLFVVMAVLVNRILAEISHRQVALRTAEDEAVAASARSHVALVQRSLWLADLRAQTRSILLRLSEVDGPVPDPLRAEALLLEAALRESLVARNVMSDELAVLTEGARRRGVEVRLVDSRHSVLPAQVGQVLLDVVRHALAAEQVSRLVVRVAPEGGTYAASVLSEDAAGTHLVRIGADAAAIVAEVRSAGR